MDETAVGPPAVLGPPVLHRRQGVDALLAM